MNTAVLVMDLKESFLANFPNLDEIVSSAAKVVTAARAQNIPVIYIKPEFRDGTPEISPNNKFFNFIKDKMPNAGGVKGDPFAEEIAPLDSDIVIGKKRISAFHGTELDVVLRAKNITDLVLMGVMTKGAVLSTVCDAADRDYRLTVISDACADSDPQVHEFLTQKIFTMQAEVLTADEWAEQKHNL